MPGKHCRWLRKAHRLLPRSKGKGDSNRQEGLGTPPAAPATLSEGAAGSLSTDASSSQTAEPEPPSIQQLQSQPIAALSSNPITSPIQNLATTPSAEHSPAREVAQKKAGIQPEQLWDQAYDDLKRDETKLLDFYEAILSQELDSSKGTKGNIIEQDREKRFSQMDHLLDAGMDKTAKLARNEKKIGDAIKVVLSVKEAIGSGLQAVPIAALAWTGICVVLEVLQNPINEMTANRDGIAQVVSNMKWYSSLSKLFFDEVSQNADLFAELRIALEKRILDLYKALLKYIIKSICAYYRNPVLQHLRNLVKLEDWSGSLDEVNKAEKSVITAASDFGVRQANSYLGLLVHMQISQAQDEIMQKLCVTDMAAEIKSLQQRKDSLLADSYKWILGNQQYQEFTEWQSGDTKTLLWIKGDAGKGKTMLLIGIVDELTTQLDTLFDKSHLSYFFCQGTDNRLNTATAILRGLIWMLLRQQKSLMHHLDIFKDLGLTLFEARTAFYNLKKILQCMLEDPALERAYLVIDALDECKKEEPGQQQLLELISEMSAKNNKVKWLVSSRNEREIEAVLEEDPTRARLSLELNAASVAGAVNVYIDYKMSQLAERYQKAYAARNNPKIREKRQRVQGSVAKELRQKADGTFLWVALVFKQIEGCGADKVLERVKQMPSDLHSMYTQMMRQVDIRDDAADCKKVLLAVVNAYRPLHSSELATLAGLSDLAIHEDIVRHCGLLTIKEDDETVYFVHQSAKDYLTQDPSSDLLKIFPLGYAEGHRTIVSRSLEAMSTILKKDVYALQHPGFPITDVENPIPDPLNPIRYACVYWVDHLCEIQEIGDVAAIDVFMKDHFLHWFEALSLIKSTSKGVLALHKLVNLLERVASQPQLLHLARDMYRFARSFSGIIEQAPLQIYSSALIFSPAHCLTRDHFKSKEPDWITQKPSIEENWSACISTLEGHSARVSSIAFSPDGQHIASGSDDRTIKIWNAESGACISTLEGHSDWVRCIAFSPDGQHIASGSDDGTIKIWNAESGACISTLEGHSAWVRCIAFSPDGQHIASGSSDGTIKIWNAESGACISTLEGHSAPVSSIAFSPDGQHIASGSDDGTIKIWNAESGACISTLEIGSAVCQLRFDSTGSNLHTDIGMIALESDIAISQPAITFRQLKQCGYGMNSDRSWIVLEGCKLLWLPKDFRPTAFDVLQRTICVGCSSGRVWNIRFDLENQV